MTEQLGWASREAEIGLGGETYAPACHLELCAEIYGLL